MQNKCNTVSNLNTSFWCLVSEISDFCAFNWIIFGVVPEFFLVLNKVVFEYVYIG